MAVFDFLKEKRPDAALEDRQDARRLVELPIEQIERNPYQPRKTFDDGSIEELASSIRQVGLIQPIVVRVSAGGYELVAGERRLRACKLLRMDTVPCLLEEGMVDQESAIVALIENLQRENLHYLEEAECYASLLATYHLTQEQLADKLGKSQSAIANKLRILKLSPTVKETMMNARMTERHARALLKLGGEEAQLGVIEQVRARSLSVKDTEKLVEKMLNQQYDQKKDGATPRPKLLRYLRDFRLFVNTINVAADQLREAGVDVDIAQTDLSDGLDLVIRIRRRQEE